MGKKSARKGKKRRDNVSDSAVSKVRSMLEQQSRVNSQAPLTVEVLLADLRQLQPLLESVQAVQSKACQSLRLSSAERKQRFAACTDWLKQEAPGCLIGETWEFDVNVAEGSGVTACKDLAKGDLFIRIPRRIMMTEASVATSRLGPILGADRLVCAMPSLGLATLLLLERAAGDSFWKPYIDILPASFPLPMFATLTELEALSGSPTLLNVLKLKQATIRQYVYIHELLRKHNMADAFVWVGFQWAVGAMMSRQNRIPAQDGAGPPMLALIPGWDCCNHRDGEVATFFDTVQDASESFTMASLRQGEGIYLYYGARPNSQLYQYQGFVFQQNRNDRLPWFFSLNDDPLAKLRAILLSKWKHGQAPSPSAPFFLPIHMPSTFGEPNEQGLRLLSYLRLLSLDKADCACVLKGASLASLVSLNNEKAALRLGLLQLRVLASGYSSTLEEDEVLLASQLSEHVANAVRMRMSEKRLIREAEISLREWAAKLD